MRQFSSHKKILITGVRHIITGRCRTVASSKAIDNAHEALVTRLILNHAGIGMGVLELRLGPMDHGALPSDKLTTYLCPHASQIQLPCEPVV